MTPHKTNSGATAAVEIVIDGVASVKPAGKEALVLLPAAPNPVSGTPILRFCVFGEYQARLALHDAQGKLQRTLFAGRAGAEWRSVPMDASGLAAGVYYLRLESEIRSVTSRVTVAR
jgi:hypothetical protein